MANRVLPTAHLRGARRMNPNDPDDGPMLPGRDPKLKVRGVTLYLEAWLWDELDAMVEATNAGIRDKKEHFSRNELIEFFLRGKAERWRREQAPKKINRP